MSDLANTPGYRVAYNINPLIEAVNSFDHDGNPTGGEVYLKVTKNGDTEHPAVVINWQDGRSQEKDQFQVFRDIGNDFYKLVETILEKDTNQNIYLFGHIELNDKNLVQLKTAGKTIRDNIAPEGLTNIVLEAVNDLGEFVFKVRSDGLGVKSPIDMFEDNTIPNDLKLVDQAINKYYKGGK